MKILSISFVFLMITFGVTAALADNQPETGMFLEEISYGPATADYQVLFFKLNSVLIPKIFKIKGEKPRLVIDFFDTALSSSAKKIDKIEGGLIKNIRFGIHNDPPKTRVVVDLETDREYTFEVKPGDQEKPLEVELIFEEESAESVDQAQKSELVAEEEAKPLAKPLQVKKSVQQELEKPPAGEKSTEPQEIVQETTVQPPPESVVADTTDSEGEAEASTGATPAEQKVKSEPMPAEERVNKIIANIKEPKPIAAAADPILLDVSYESTANDSEMVLFKLNDFYPPIVFGIEKGNPRVVCDFLDTLLAVDIPPVIQTNGIFVRKIRTARHPSPEKVRVVLDLVPNKNYDLQQVFFKEDNLFVIIISEFEKESVNPLKTVPEAGTSQ
jgi:hypothetical protein